MKARFLHLLFGILLLCAQALAAAHVVEHALEETHKSTLHHACTTCHAAHNLGHALTGKSATLPVVAAEFIPAAFLQNDRAALPAPLARQQAPPCA